MASEAAILLKDVQGEKSGKLLQTKSTKQVCRGELLLLLPRDRVIPRKDGRPAHNYQVASDPAVTLYCPEDDVAPLSDYEYNLMKGVKSRGARYEVFQKDLLDWGSKLKAGDFVYATLPSKSPVPNQQTVSKIEYVGPLPNEHGIQFGVEIMDPAYRKHGSSNGFFGGEQFFTCEENTALFVSLDRLLPMEGKINQQEPPQPPQDARGHQVVTQSQAQAQQSNLDQGNRKPGQQSHQDHSPNRHGSKFRLDDRVIVYNKKGVGIHGSVRWIENVKYRGQPLLAIGIETDTTVSVKDFEEALLGLSQYFNRRESWRGKIVLPEAFIAFEHEDAASRNKKMSSTQDTCVDPDTIEEERVIQAVKKQSEEEYLKEALNTKVVNLEEQVRALERFEKEKKQQYQSQSRPNVDCYDHYEVIPGAADLVTQPSNQPLLGRQGQAPLSTSPSPRDRKHVYESPDRLRRNLGKMHDHHSVQDENLLGGHRSDSGTAVALHHQRSMPCNADAHLDLTQHLNVSHPSQQFDNDNQRQYQNIPGAQQPTQPSQHVGWHSGNNQDFHHGQAYQQSQGYQQNQDYQQGQAYQQGQHGVAAPLPHGSPQQPHYANMQPQYANVHPQHGDGQYQGQQGLNQLAQGHGGGGQPSDGGQTVAFAAKEDLAHLFSMGSTVQLLSSPPRYGVIEWIGTIPNIDGRIAGVELEESMEGCGDGTWNGVRYFSCRQGHGFFCPVSSLAPDQRFAPTIVADANPLDYVAFDEEQDQHVNVGQINRYIGESKGIQGQQNSCYLDSTVFGLFAVSDAFDNMFLQQQQGDPAGDEVKHLLWKGIVNPLRKNGVVRHESVMRLRNKLEELGKMKGVNQDEKDPEEFLNMLFKHTLHVPPFINIKRPYGVEQEYFVQLFVEPDDSIKLPTVEDLLGRMFKEQKIRFTKVPSKLLIQIPRYGRQFKTYQKTIPSIKLKLKGLVSSKRKCFICAESAWNECGKCLSNFTSDNPTPPEVVYFCENCAKLSHKEGTGRQSHKFTEVADDPGRITELDLLSVICIETSHYICFTRSEDRWVFFDSMANRVNDMYNIPKVVDCTADLNEWVYPANRDLSRLINTPPRGLPEYVRRFTQDIYLCVYIQPDVGMYGDFEDEDDSSVI